MTRAPAVALLAWLGHAGCGSHAGGGGVAPCGAGAASCGGRCIDITVDDHNCGRCGNTCTAPQHCMAGACSGSRIEHVVLIVEENHTFDAYFGRYCTAQAGTNPACTVGPACCERAPDTEPRGAAPLRLDDVSNFATERDHQQACELQQIDGGLMDRYVFGASGSMSCLGTGPNCSSADNWALADVTTVGPYWSFAQNGALADRYFQPVVGGTASNNMYFAVAQFVFGDNDQVPMAVGTPYGCAQGACLTTQPVTYRGQQTIADVLLAAGKTFAVYADGYADAAAAAPACENVPTDCPYDPLMHPIAAEACKYDASDIPFAYYAQLADGPNMKDYRELAQDVARGALPSFAYVKARGFRNEHPNVSTITDGVRFVTATVQLILASSLAANTLILLTWDEGGGFFDHVPPPASPDAKPYGTRVPLLAIGPFARTNTISHVPMEHSSIVKFLELNFTGRTGQLNGRDALVHDLGSLLDPTTTGIAIPW